MVDVSKSFARKDQGPPNSISNRNRQSPPCQYGKLVFHTLFQRLNHRPLPSPGCRSEPRSWRMVKTGSFISPFEKVKGGNRRLHAVESVCYAASDGRLKVVPLGGSLRVCRLREYCRRTPFGFRDRRYSCRSAAGLAGLNVFERPPLVRTAFD